jgi:hypothetical protein
LSDLVVWSKVGSDLLDGQLQNEQYGYSVSISDDGSIVAAGALLGKDPVATGYGTGASGFTSIYQKTSGDNPNTAEIETEYWNQLGQTIYGEGFGNRAGSAIKLSGDGSTIAIGASLHGDGAGHVRIFNLINEDNPSTDEIETEYWQQLGDDIKGVYARDYLANIPSSISLSNDGKTIAVGSYGNDDVGDNAGHVRIFNLVNGDNKITEKVETEYWQQLGSDIQGEVAFDHTGRTLSLSGNSETVAVYSYGKANTLQNGRVRIFDWDGSNWTQIGSSIDGEVAKDNSTGFGISLTDDGKKIAISTRTIDTNSEGQYARNIGKVRIFERDGNNWTQLGDSIFGDEPNSVFGTYVSFSGDGNRLAISDNKTGARIFNLINGDNPSTEKIETEYWQSYGEIEGAVNVDLSGDGSTVIIGNAWGDIVKDNAGWASVYQLPDTTRPIISGPSGSAGDSTS